MGDRPAGDAPYVLHRGDVLDAYAGWPAPDSIVSDGERLKGTLRRAAPRVYKPTTVSAAHLNQKPLEFMERLALAVRDREAEAAAVTT